MATETEAKGMHPQGCFIQLFCDDKAERYELQNIKYELHPTGVAVCTYNTPKSLNALSKNQQWETFALLEHMERDDNVKVAIWTGSGEKAFNSGADLREDGKLTIPERIMEKMRARGMGPVDGDFVLKPMTKAFWDFPKPSIVAVNGLAVGGAANIALINFHDMAVCSSNARFMYPFPRLGFTPELGSSFMMPFSVGMPKAKEMMFLGDWITADDAKQLGLVNKVVSPDQLMPETVKIAERLCLMHPTALRLSKKILNHHVRVQLDAILDAESETINQCLMETGGTVKVQKWMKQKAEWMKEVKSKL